MGKRSAAERRKRANASAPAPQAPVPQAPAQHTNAMRQSSPPAKQGPDRAAHDATTEDALTGQTSSSRLPVPPRADTSGQPEPATSGSHAVTVAPAAVEDETPHAERPGDESLVRSRFLLTDEMGRPLRRQRTVRERLDDWAAYVMPFSWRERDWGRTGRWRARLLSFGAVAAALLIAIVAGLSVFHWAEHAGAAIGQLPAPQPTVSGPSGIIVQSGPNGTTPTPTLPTYLLGAWCSDTAPTTGSTIQVYVRVTSSTSGPIAHQPVTLSVQYPSGTNTIGPVSTDAYGLAIFNVPTGTGNGSQVVFITASATIHGTAYTTPTTFTPY